MGPTLNNLPYAQRCVAISLSLGRPVCRADRLEMTDFGDCVRNDFWWNDGACYTLLHDTKEEAMEHARANGFTEASPGVGTQPPEDQPGRMTM